MSNAVEEVTRKQIEAMKLHCEKNGAIEIGSEQALAVLTLALERLDMEPRPIAEAPKDGSEIFAYWDDEWVKTYWVKRNGFEGWQLPSGRTIKAYAPETWRPTHFNPLSSLPKPKGE